MNRNSPAVAHLDVETIRHQLEAHLRERLEVQAELAPRALPTVDPVAFQAAGSNRLLIEQITAALNRLDAGTYGRCTRCASEIATARLEALPYAAACIVCQSQVDAA